MSGTVNKVILIGHLGKDPDVRTTQYNNKIANFTVATSEKWKDRNGEKQERTEWHRISVYSEGLAKLAEQYLKKGSKVYIQGQLETRKWQDQSGNDRYTTEIVLRPYKSELTFLDTPQRDNQTSPSSAGQNSQPQAYLREGADPENYPMDDFEDEIPF